MKPKYIVLHHSASPITQTAEVINAYHKKLWNFKSSLGGYAGYQYIIEHTGRLTQWRADTERGAHTIGRNDDSIGVCVVGWFDAGHDSLPTQKQQDALSELLRQKMTQHGLSTENIRLHREFANKSCPGLNITKTWINNLIKNMSDKQPYIKSDLRNVLKKFDKDFDHEKSSHHKKMSLELDKYLDEEKDRIAKVKEVVKKNETLQGVIEQNNKDHKGQIADLIEEQQKEIAELQRLHINNTEAVKTTYEDVLDGISDGKAYYWNRQEFKEYIDNTPKPTKGVLEKAWIWMVETLWSKKPSGKCAWCNKTISKEEAYRNGTDACDDCAEKIRKQNVE